MKWFRLYSSVLQDPKVQRLSPALFKHWVNLLCLANESEPRGLLPCLDDIAFALRIKPSEAAAMMTQLRRAGLVDQTSDGRDFPHNWPQRQRKSDDVAARVGEHRERKAGKQETSNDASNDNETLHATLQTRSNFSLDVDADEDTEPDTELEENHLSADVAGVATPRARGRAASTSTSATPRNAVDLCERIVEQTHLPQRVEVLDQLAAVIESHLARGLSPGDIWRDVLNLTDPTRSKHVKRPNVSQISNWLAHTHPADDLVALAAVGSSNGHNGRHASRGQSGQRGDAANGYHARRRQPDLPDPTQNGDDERLFHIASDDDLDN